MSGRSEILEREKAVRRASSQEISREKSSEELRSEDAGSKGRIQEELSQRSRIVQEEFSQDSVKVQSKFRKSSGRVQRTEESSSSSSATLATPSSPTSSRRWVHIASVEGTERGPPEEKADTERSAYLLKPESEADMGQKLMPLPSSSSSSSSTTGSHYLLGRGKLVSWGGRRDGGGIPHLQVTESIFNDNVSYFPAMPGLPRCTAQFNLARSEDDKSGCTMLAGRGDNKGLAEISADGEQESDDITTVA